MGALISSQQFIDLSTAYNINNQTQGACNDPFNSTSICFTKLSRARSGLTVNT